MSVLGASCKAAELRRTVTHRRVPGTVIPSLLLPVCDSKLPSVTACQPDHTDLWQLSVCMRLRSSSQARMVLMLSEHCYSLPGNPDLKCRYAGGAYLDPRE